jgi:hypothetical protein
MHGRGTRRSARPATERQADGAPLYGNWQPATGNRKLATGNRKLETGNWKLATGNRQPETGNWQPATDYQEPPMNHYLLSMYQPDGEPPPPDRLDRVMRDMHTLVEEARAAGVLVFNGGLHPPSTATVVRFQRGEALITDGPFVEAKEHLGGFLIVRAPHLDAALGWARKLARAVTIDEEAGGLPIEVRPFHGDVNGGVRS